MPLKASRDNTEVEAINESEGPAVVKISLPREVYDEYQRLAIAQELTVAELLQHRLARCLPHSALRPLYFNDSQRAQVEILLQKRPLDSAEQVLPALTAALSVGVGGHTIPLTAAQIRRLEFSTYGDLTVKDRLTQLVQRGLQRELGV